MRCVGLSLLNLTLCTLALGSVGCRGVDADGDDSAGPTGDSDVGPGDADTYTDPTGESSDDATSGSTGSDSSTNSDTATDGEDEEAGVKFDLGDPGDSGDSGDSGGNGIPLTCDNIDMLPATSVGCEFFAVQFPSYPNALPFGISVGNPSAEPAMVTIEDMRGPGGTLREITSFEIQPTQSVLTPINGTGGVLAGESHMVSMVGLHEHAAFRVSSSVPVTAMQLFPVGGGLSHVSEASMLLPVNALDQSYLSAGWKQFSSYGSVVVVAIEDGTEVLTEDGDFMLDAFDAWHFSSGAEGTGFFVGADHPVAVFSGVDCTMVPEFPWYACDHLEEQMLPLSAWGTHYVGGRHPHRVPAINPEPEDVFWRIIGAVEDTTVTLTPPVAGGPIQLAQVGDWAGFSTAESFEATGDNPFLLVQYMSGCYNVITSSESPNNCDQGATGDPYMLQATPVEQWLTQLPFLTDSSYPRDFVTIMREQGTTVSLDCLGEIDDSHFTPIPGTIYEVGQVDLDIDGQGGEGDCVDGAQFLTADQPVGVSVGGVDWATSYGYPGGLSLNALWEPPLEPQG